MHRTPLMLHFRAWGLQGISLWRSRLPKPRIALDLWGNLQPEQGRAKWGSPSVGFVTLVALAAPREHRDPV